MAYCDGCRVRDEHVDSLTARAEAAEAERDEARQQRDHWKGLAETAEGAWPYPLEELTKARARLAEAEVVLEWYADPDNWTSEPSKWTDAGERARAFLKAKGGE